MSNNVPNPTSNQFIPVLRVRSFRSLDGGGGKYAREFLGKHAEERHLPPRMSNATAGSTPAAARHDFTFTAVGSRRRKVGSDNLAPPPTLPGGGHSSPITTREPTHYYYVTLRSHLRSARRGATSDEGCLTNLSRIPR